MEVKEKEKGLEVYELAQIIENSKHVTAWMNMNNDELIQLRGISPKDAQRLEELGLEFSNDYCWRISEEQRLPFTFLFDSAKTRSTKLPELTLFDQTYFPGGRVFLFKTEEKERLFGLAKFGEKYEGIRQADVEPGFFALVIFLKKIKNVG